MLHKTKFMLIITLVIAAAWILPVQAIECPDFTLENLDGDLITLSDHLGNGPVLLAFWATWCAPCKKELPHLQALSDKFAERGFTLVTIAEDTPKTQAKVQPFVDAKRFTFPVLLDPDNEVLNLFQGSTLPHRVLIDADGNIVETHQGYNPGDEVLLEETIVNLLTGETADE